VCLVEPVRGRPSTRNPTKLEASPEFCWRALPCGCGRQLGFQFIGPTSRGRSKLFRGAPDRKTQAKEMGNRRANMEMRKQTHGRLVEQTVHVHLNSTQPL
jgi:hypothetical protein